MSARVYGLEYTLGNQVVGIPTLNWNSLGYIRESVDSLCRDGADMPIVHVHRKAFLTRERLHSKPFWAPSYSIPVFLYPTIPPK